MGGAGVPGRESCVEEDADRAVGRGHEAGSDVAKLSKTTVVGERRQHIYCRETDNQSKKEGKHHVFSLFPQGENMLFLPMFI